MASIEFDGAKTRNSEDSEGKGSFPDAWGAQQQDCRFFTSMYPS